MKYIMNEHVSERLIGDEIFLFERESSEIHTLNKTATLVYNLLKENADPKIITEKLCSRFEVSQETAAKDVEEIISQFLTKNIFIIK